jgi:hypothetical protein
MIIVVKISYLFLWEQKAMPGTNREIHELLVDYTGALRDGCIPVFLKSLTREEAHRIASSREFWDAGEAARVLNGVGFADKAVPPNMSLFVSRVDAEIASRLKNTKVLSQAKRRTHREPEIRTERKTERSI